MVAYRPTHPAAPTTHATPGPQAHLTLTRWDPAKPATLDNLVLLTWEEADAHEQLSSLEELRAREPEFCARVDRRLQLAGEQLAN